MSKGALSASLGPSHLFIIIINVRIIMKVLEIIKITMIEMINIEIELILHGAPPPLRQWCSLQMLETLPVRGKADLNSPED